jgi:hypothetical protein
MAKTKSSGNSKAARPRKKTASAKKTPRKWSAKVTRTSDALDLQSKVFKSRDPIKVARSLKRSSEKSKRRKGTPLQSAMSMLNFYINRAGKNLPAMQKKVLNEAKKELRELYGRPAKKN